MPPTRQSPPPPPTFPIVGIGASAGGLAAFEAFFSGMPADTDPGMAFVLVQHLAPDHKSILIDLIRRYTRMQVFEVEDGMVVLPNCAYIIPPNYDMAFLNGSCTCSSRSPRAASACRLTYFFRSLADDQHERAIGIVLSGTGSDGTLGVRAIKGAGGMVMAQNTASSEFDGMPRSAIATGLVDYELPPAEMPAQLMAYAAHAFGKLPRATVPANPRPRAPSKEYSCCCAPRPATTFRNTNPAPFTGASSGAWRCTRSRPSRRYVKYLQQTPAEVEALFRDLLIGVTNFFRDPEAFAALARAGHPQAV